MTNNQLQLKRMIKVLDRIKYMCMEDESNVEMFNDFLGDMLNEMRGEDLFGTEGQSDPRGDMRSRDWSMWDVEGVDDE